jgi:hypothetical protein
LKVKTKIILATIFFLSFFVYRSDFIMFNFIEKINNSTNNKFHLSFLRNKAIKYIDELNPFVGKLALSYHDLPVINISLSKKAADNISKTIDVSMSEADDKGRIYLSNLNKNYSNTTIEFNGEQFKAKIRLHGSDFMHFYNKKKSLYLKLDKDKLFQNMRRFSLIILEESSIDSMFSYKMQEWLTGFKVNSFLVKVNINGIEQGVYVLEEKLHKSLLEKNDLSGVDVIKPNDEWDQQHSVFGGGTRHVNPFNWDIPSSRFENISEKNVGQLRQYEALTKCKNYYCLSKFIDKDKTAQVDAMRLLLGNNDVFRGDNQKLLYSTSTGRFFPYLRVEGGVSRLNYFFDKDLYAIDEIYKNNLFYQLGKSNEFREIRNKYLWKLLQNKELLISMYEDLYKKNIPAIIADSNHYTNGRYIKYRAETNKKNFQYNLSLIQKYLSYSKASTNLKYLDNNKLQLTISPDSNSHLAVSQLDFNFEGVSVATIKDEQTGSTSKFNLDNPIEYFDNKKFITTLNNNYDVVKKDYSFIITLDRNSSIFDYEIEYKNTLSNQKLSSKDNYSIFQPLSKFHKSNTPDFLIEEGDSYVVNEGQYFLDDNLIIPHNKSLVLNSGVSIKIPEDKSIIVYGSLYINGSKNKPVEVKKIDENFGTFAALGNGLTEVKINYLNLSGGSEDYINGVHFSGGLSVYSHKEVSILNSHIHNNKADDGLNIKNSNIFLKGNLFESNFADQVDLDYVVGEIRNNNFLQKSLNEEGDLDLNGDGLDLSGSSVLIFDNKYDGFLDKGISIGERTNAIISKNYFNNNYRAVTVKDESKAYFDSNIYDQNDKNIELYRKKLIFDYPSAFNLNEKHAKEKISKTKNSHYFKPKNEISITDSNNLESVFLELRNGDWVDFE